MKQASIGKPTGSEIAVIAMACRFPGANDIGAFWRNLREGVESIRRFNDAELIAAGADLQLIRRDEYVKAHGCVSDIELFDAEFFGLTPREAEVLDVQHRLFLECAWETIERAGYAALGYKGSIGLYASAGINLYLLNNLLPNRWLVESVGGYQLMISNDKDYLATRAAYRLNLRGPSVVVQTACSSSLVAVHMACQSLLNGECDMALSGGVSIQVPQESGYLYQEGMIRSADGHCRTFDSRASGTVGGSGVGIVLLKRLDEALQDGDYIHAIIKASAVNNDGHAKVGYAAPCVEGQAAVISEALAVADVDPASISYVECHGTGTPLGDPIEIAALNRAYQCRGKRDAACWIGSVKTNVGHLDTAAGVAGLIKTALALENRAIPASLHFEQPNPEIDFDSTPFRVQTRLSAWDASAAPRRAGVSSFGIGGTNAHLILEEAPARAPSGPARPKQVLMLSAKTKIALEETTANLARHLDENPQADFGDIAYTLSVGREAHNYRLAVVADDLRTAAERLRSVDRRRVMTELQQRRHRPVVFMFSGQGSQYSNMASHLYESEPFFRQQLDACAVKLQPWLQMDIRDALFARGVSAGDEDQIHETEIAQPALFALEYAIARQWMEWGVQPAALVGHSIGEYVAACLAGVLPLPDALGLMAQRGKLMARLPRGSMLAVPLCQQRVQSLLNAEISLAAVNAPELCVISGDSNAIACAHRNLARDGVQCVALKTSHAFHSRMMEPIMAELENLVGGIDLGPPAIPYLSNLTGAWITELEATRPEYWSRHLRETVNFVSCVSELRQNRDFVFLEIGPGRSLCTLVRAAQGTQLESDVFSSLPTARDAEGDYEHLLKTLSRLWLAGVEIDWPAYFKHERRHRVSLPTYPFQRQRYWIDPPNRGTTAGGRTSRSRLQGPAEKSDLANWLYVPSWRRTAWPAYAKRDKKPHTWLVFLDPAGEVGPKLLSYLQRAGDEIVSVVPGGRFERTDGFSYAVNPKSASDYKSLIDALHESHRIPHKVLHLWNAETERVLAGASAAATQDLAFFSLLFLAQAIARIDTKPAIDIAVISAGMQALAGERTLWPSRATVLGPVRVIPKEFSNLTCRSIDIADPCFFTSEAALHRLYAELIDDAPDAVVALRDGQRWAECFEPIQPTSSHDPATPWKREGVYLITGGLGGIGLALAEHLAKNLRAKLVLTARTPFPTKDRWAQWLSTTDANAVLGRTIAKLQAFERAGAEVLVAHADVSNEDEIRAVFRQAFDRYGRIDGVVHAAGVPGGGLIELKTREKAEDVLRPKVAGGLILARLVREIPLDFVVFCSSVTSLGGDIGQVDYCAANAFLDALANQLWRDQVPAVSISWDTWRDVGMAANAQLPRDLRAMVERSIESEITAEQGIHLFERCLGAGVPHVIVSKTDLAERIESATNLNELQAVRLTPTRHDRPESAAAYVSPSNESERELAEIWQELLGIDPIGIHDNFFEIGGHSLLATQLLSRLRERFGVNVSIAAFFDHPTIHEMAEELAVASIEKFSEHEIREILAEIDDSLDDEAHEKMV